MLKDRLEARMPVIAEWAKDLRVHPLDLATVHVFETARTMSPTICNAMVMHNGKLKQVSIEWDDLPDDVRARGGVGTRDEERVIAMGAIQFTAATLRGMGIADFAQLARMPFEEQPVVRYLRMWLDRLPAPDLDDLYLSILLPSAVGLPDKAVVWNNKTNAYRLNQGFDSNRDGVITVGEILTKIRALRVEVGRLLPCWERNPPECIVRGGEGG